MNPKKLGKLDNADQELWKLPLPAFIESLYRKRFGKDRPDVVQSIEERAHLLEVEKGHPTRSEAVAARGSSMSEYQYSDVEREPTQVVGIDMC